ncbi:hypothetical protein [Bartonella sp. HY761]|uniref:hypothetical protein n=1 Tax=Bartonella sp. HY761 TaxID=2979330 RepID=UPI002209070F|nr:hypothetical protein [Bartonella sp. HY761]UXN05147.1 hypothetical protein N6A79_07360 [Bartonella sp. HY761]
MKFKLANIDDDFDETVFRNAVANDLRKFDEEASYSFTDIQIIFVAMIIDLSSLFPNNLLEYLDVAIKNRLGEVSDDIRAEKRNELKKIIDSKNCPRDIYIRGWLIYLYLWTLEEYMQTRDADTYRYAEHLEYFEELDPDIYIDLDQICFSYYYDKKNKINPLIQLSHKLTERMEAQPASQNQ